MKHKLKITIILLVMFLVTQFIGLYVVNHYSPIKIVNGEAQGVEAPKLPYGLETPEIKQDRDFLSIFITFAISFVFALFLIFFLIKMNTKFVLRIWFFVVVVIALGISLNAIFYGLKFASIIAICFAVPLAFFKIYYRHSLIHNSTELLIYPGIAAIFVPILNIWTLVILLILISIYDMWAVWKSGIMQKMAKYQMDNLKVFSGFFVPYLDKKTKEKLKKIPKEKLKNKKFKVNVAILGGGDVVFPIIASGVILKTLGFWPAICVIIGATIGLGYLFSIGEKKKFYPAMPFITAGIFLGMLIGRILF